MEEPKLLIKIDLYRQIFSVALILASGNPKYDKILFIEFLKKYKFTTNCVQKLFFFVFVLTFKTVMTFKTIFVHNMF